MELDQLLDDNTPSLANAVGIRHDTAAAVVAYFREGEWQEEHYLVAAIKKHLRTPEHKAIMNQHDFTIEDVLNARVKGEEAQRAVERIFADWNGVLGFRSFGS